MAGSPALGANDLQKSDLDWLIPHQANLRINQMVAVTLELPEDKVLNNIQKYGNTTAATIPLALKTALDQRKLQKGHLVLLAAVGAGFTVGSVLLRWSGVSWD